MTCPSLSNPAKILFIVLWAAASFFIVMATVIAPPKAGAQAGATASCSTKVREEACKAKVASECGNKPAGSDKDNCMSRIIGGFTNKPASGGAATTPTSTPADDPVDPANDKLLSPRAASDTSAEGHKCGNAQAGDQVKTRFNFGCIGDNGPSNMGPIEDMVYAIIRFLSYGIGVVLVMAMILSGIQYSASEGNAEASQAAKSRIQNVIVGLFLYLISFSLLQYLVPGGVFAGTLFTVEIALNILGFIPHE